MTREKIQRIIDKRKPLVQKITDAQDRLRDIMTTFRKLRDLCRNNLSGDALSQERQALEEIFASFDVKKAKDLADHLKNISRRLSRDTLNIAVIGTARQGKSQLLQTITGLGSDVIPVSNGRPYTGARSDIINDPAVEEGDAYADVDFMNEEHFIDKMASQYFDELSEMLPGISVPQSLEDFEDMMLPDEESFPYISRQTASIYIKRLEELQKNIGKLRPFLTGGTLKGVKRGDIRSYVVQYDTMGEKEIPFHSHLAVEKVNIHCRFTNTDVDSLKLIDLPGLGEIRAGNAERMVEALADQVDLVLFMKKPDNKGTLLSTEDLRIYSQASSALGEKLPIERWSFWIINHTKTDGDNIKQCGLFEKELNEKGIKTARNITADCSDPDEVTRLIIEPALDFLEASIESNDREYAASLQAMMDDTVKTFREILVKTRQLLSAENNFEKVSEMFDKCFDVQFNALRYGLEGCLSPLEAKKDQPCTELMDKLSGILDKETQAVDEGKLPGITQEAVSRAIRIEGYAPTAYAKLASQLRTQLNKTLQGELDELVERVVLAPMKKEMCRVLMEDGKLGLHFKGGTFGELVSFIEDGKGEIMPSILSGLKKLDEAKINCQERIQPLIREALNYLDPRAEEFTSAQARTNSPEEVYESLVQVYSDALSTLSQNLAKEDIYSEPNAAALSKASDFIDDVLYSDKDAAERGGINSETQWRALYRYIRSDIWPEDFGSAKAKQDAFAKISGPVNSGLALCERTVLIS